MSDQFHIQQARRNSKPIRGASSRCDQHTGRLFITPELLDLDIPTYIRNRLQRLDYDTAERLKQHMRSAMEQTL